MYVNERKGSRMFYYTNLVQLIVNSIVSVILAIAVIALAFVSANAGFGIFLTFLGLGIVVLSMGVTILEFVIARKIYYDEEFFAENWILSLGALNIAALFTGILTIFGVLNIIALVMMFMDKEI